MFCLLKKNNKKKRYPIIYRPLVLFCLVDSISRVFLVSFLWLCESSFILIFPYHRQFIYEKKVEDIYINVVSLFSSLVVTECQHHPRLFSYGVTSVILQSCPLKALTDH